MKITTFCLCILGALAGVWIADLGAWPSAGGIWVICIILAIDGGFRSITIEITRNINSEGDRKRTLSMIYPPGGLTQSIAPPPPPKKPANPFKVGDRVLVKCVRMDGEVRAVCGSWVKVCELAATSSSGWYEVDECELIEEPKKFREFKVGDRVRDKITGASGTIDSFLTGRVLVNFAPIGKAGVAVPGWMYLEDMELICEKQP